MQKNKINIVYATDDNFANVLGVSIASILKTNKNDDINFFIIEDNVSRRHKKYIENICLNSNSRLPIWIKSINVKELVNINNLIADRGSMSQFSRLFLLTLLPSDVERIIYLDCDTLIVNDIKSLWEEALDGNVIGALLDAFPKGYRKNLILSDEDIVINSGVMLIDLLEWKKHNIEKKLLDFIELYDGAVPQSDQGALSGVLSKKTKVINPRFNLISLFFDYSYSDLIKYRNPTIFYSEDEIIHALNNPVVIHFTSGFLSFRPWELGCSHPYYSIWWEYMERLEFTDYSLKIKKQKKTMKIYLIVRSKLPNNIALRVDSFLQTVIRPYFEYIKYKVKKVEKKLVEQARN